MYSFQPLINENNLPFTIIIIFALLALALFFAELSYWSYKERFTGYCVTFWTITALLLILCYFAFASYVKNPETVYKNEKVTAKLVGFVAEGFGTNEQSGKTHYKKEYSETYVTYKLADNSTVMLKASLGQTYPETAILFRN